MGLPLEMDPPAELRSTALFCSVIGLLPIETLQKRTVDVTDRGSLRVDGLIMAVYSPHVYFIIER